MKEITKYAANNGTVFETKKEALDYEQLLQQLDKVDSLLRPVPNTIEFANGGGYVQQEAKSVDLYWNQLSEITEQTCGIIAKSLSQVRRVVDNGNNPHSKPLGHRWNRLACIDKLSREWGQPYYANHPEDGTQVEVGHASETH